MQPYSIGCSTCGARLKVRDARAIGELSLCPKCGSMVMITPPTPAGSDANIPGPRGMSDSSQQIIVRRPTSFASDFEDAAALFADTVDDLVPAAPPAVVPAARTIAPQPKAPPAPQPTAPESKTPAEAKPQVEAPAAEPKSAIIKTTPKKIAKPLEGNNAALAKTPAADAPAPAAAPTPPPIAPPTESMSSIELDPLTRSEAMSPLAQAGARLEQSFDLSPTPPVQSPAPAPAAAFAATDASLAGASTTVIDDRPWASPTQQIMRRYALLGGAVVAAVVVVGVLLAVVFRNPSQPAVATAPADIITTEQSLTPIADPPLPPDDEIDVPPPESTDLEVPPTEPAEPVDDAPPENIDDEAMPPPEETDEPSADGDAPPIFADGGDEPAGDVAVDEPAGDEVADSGLGEFAPLVDAFPVPELPAADPAADDPAPSPEEEPTAIARRERPEPLAVDVAARLADPIDGIDTGGAPLVKFLELISQLSTIPITLPPESLAQVQATATSPVSLVQRDANVAKILQAGLAEHQLKFEIRGEQLVVVPAPKRDTGVLTVSHPVDDIAPDAAALAALAEQVRKFVSPSTWDTAGGAAKIDLSKGKLDVAAGQTTQFEVHVFCQKLRVARGLAPRSKLDPAMFALASRSQRCAAKLATPVRAIFHAERPLARILNHLEQATEATLLIDWEALLAEGWPPHSTTTIVIDDQPLSTALDELLTPMDLAWRAIDENTVQITSRAAVETRPELEFYSVAPQIDAGAAPEKLIADLQTKLGDELFTGDEPMGTVAFDEPSKCLIVRLPQTQQRTLEAALTPEP